MLKTSKDKLQRNLLTMRQSKENGEFEGEGKPSCFTHAPQFEDLQNSGQGGQGPLYTKKHHIHNQILYNCHQKMAQDLNQSLLLTHHLVPTTLATFLKELQPVKRKIPSKNIEFSDSAFQ